MKFSHSPACLWVSAKHTSDGGQLPCYRRLRRDRSFGWSLFISILPTPPAWAGVHSYGNCQISCFPSQGSQGDSFFFFLACGILVPWPWIELGPQQWKHGVLTTGQLGNSKGGSLLKNATLHRIDVEHAEGYKSKLKLKRILDERHAIGHTATRPGQGACEKWTRNSVANVTHHGRKWRWTDKNLGPDGRELQPLWITDFILCIWNFSWHVYL